MKQALINALWFIMTRMNAGAHNKHAELAWIHYTYICPFDWDEVDDMEQTYGFDWTGSVMMRISRWCQDRLLDLGEPPF